jgi:hypothetical protein
MKVGTSAMRLRLQQGKDASSSLMSLTTKGQNKSIHPDHEAVHQSKS